jgi:hypothetical protein
MNLIEAKNIIKEHKHQFYTYVLKRPEGIPFYVGKGGRSCNGYRIEHHEMEAIKGRKGNLHKTNVIKKIWKEGLEVDYEIVLFTKDEEIAFDKEMELINLYGRRNDNTGILTNMTDGGEGSFGYIHSEKSRKKISDNNSHYWKGKKFSDEYRKKISESNVGNKGRKLTEDWKRKISESLKGRVSPNKGNKFSDETKRKMSITRKGKVSPKKGKKYSKSVEKIKEAEL